MKNRNTKKTILLLIFLLSMGSITKAQTVNIDPIGFDWKKDANSSSLVNFDTANGTVCVNCGGTNLNALASRATVLINGSMLVNVTAEELLKVPIDPVTGEPYEFGAWVGGDGTCSTDLYVVSPDGWRDDVFQEDYDLMPLKKLEEYIKSNKHLPNIPSAKEVEENGYSQHTINSELLGKIEELTLHTIQQEKDLKKQQEIVDMQTKQIDDLLQLLENKNPKILKEK